MRKHVYLSFLLIGKLTHQPWFPKKKKKTFFNIFFNFNLCFWWQLNVTSHPHFSIKNANHWLWNSSSITGYMNENNAKQMIMSPYIARKYNRSCDLNQQVLQVSVLRNTKVCCIYLNCIVDKDTNISSLFTCDVSHRMSNLTKHLIWEQ